ncbi:MAG: type II CRISPR RNA-guided endonuclease Cas9 [Xanthomonadales bacterium]|nr:type II CRISPR RNA-guided endonuclease Cas9 [Xanthomonadales bacterium]
MTQQTYSLGLDIGIASVGWCVLGGNRIIDLGVRAFDKAETPDRGEPLNKVRREARLLRRRLYRRAWRLTTLARLLTDEGLVRDASILKQNRPPKGFPTPNLWKLRVEALDRPLDGEEWARVIYHLCKHRGFHWYSKAEQAKQESEAGAKGGSVKQGLSKTTALMNEKGYRTAAEMVLSEFPEAQRNKAGSYDKALSRVLLDAELGMLFVAQRGFGNPYANVELETEIRGNGDQRSGLFWEVKPALSGENLLNMLGHCTFEEQEKRAPKASFSAERHVWLTRLNNLRIVVNGVARGLNEDERRIALPLPYGHANGTVTYKQLRSALEKAGLDHFNFVGINDDKEKEALSKVPAFSTLAKALKEAGLEAEWKKISCEAMEGNPDTLDQIAVVLSVYKDDGEIERELLKLNLPGGERMIAALLAVSFDKFSNLSLKALRRIVPAMEKGLRYDDAVKAAGYEHHSQLVKPDAGKMLYLPSFYSARDKDGKMLFRDDIDVPRNPVVLRALNQTRKVVNAIIREYGSPAAVHIEMARDLSRPLDERLKVGKAQKEYAEENEKARSELAALLGGTRPKGRMFEKYRFYREQGGKCAYCISALDLNQVLSDDNYAQVDHALPYSRSYDDSRNNKVVVHTKCNQDKGNRTPFEYLGGAEDSPQWQKYSAWVESNHSYRLAKRNRLLRKNYGREEAEGFKARNLNDTRYICRFIKQYVEDNLQLSGDSKRCVVVSGQLTGFLRARWGLAKLREGSDRHHALDAAVVAACSHGMVKRLSDYSRRKELKGAREGFRDAETGEVLDIAALRRLENHFPVPFAHFADELCWRVGIERSTGKVLEDTTVETLLENLRTLKDDAGHPRYDQSALQTARPLFVSRAPQRRNGGAAHKDTIYAKPSEFQRLLVTDKSKQGKRSRPATSTELQGMAIEKIGLFDESGMGAARKYRLTPERLDDLVDAHRNERMIHALRLWLADRGDKPRKDSIKAYPRKPLKSDPPDGPFTGPVIKSVKLNAGPMTGLDVRGGLAQNASMVRVDVFRKDGKYHLVPVYVHHRVKELPMRAIVAFKSEDQWTPVDDDQFLFSLYPNDLIELEQKGKPPLMGYFAGCDRSTAAVSVWLHDRNTALGKDGQVRGVGVKTALRLEKLNVDVLGRIYPATPEPRRGLA